MLDIDLNYAIDDRYFEIKMRRDFSYQIMSTLKKEKVIDNKKSNK